MSSSSTPSPPPRLSPLTTTVAPNHSRSAEKQERQTIQQQKLTPKRQQQQLSTQTNAQPKLPSTKSREATQCKRQQKEPTIHLSSISSKFAVSKRMPVAVSIGDHDHTTDRAVSEREKRKQQHSLPIYQQRGQCIMPKRVHEKTLVSSMAYYVHDAIPQSSKSQQTPERIEWVSFQKYTNVNDRRRVVDMLVIGLARGYQIWAIMENGNCEEILSERRGPIRIGRLLPNDIEQSFDVHNDRFEKSRPLFAFVDSNTAANQKCTLSFLSLTSAKNVHELKFSNPVDCLLASTKILLVSFINLIVICDAMSLQKQRHISGIQVHGNLPTPVAISDIFVAFAVSELEQDVQSCGGMIEDDVSGDPNSFSVVNVAKQFSKTLSALGESVASSFSSSPQAKNILSVAEPGIVTVIDVNKLPANPLEDRPGYIDSVMAHFVAHLEPISFIAFGKGGQLLLTAGLSATYFNIFNLLPHPGSPALGAARHLYRLYRGATPAKILSCAFNVDNRWVALATNHGTTHIFAINPYGGSISMRTHASEIVNKESSFQRTADLTDADYLPIKTVVDDNTLRIKEPKIYRAHPCLHRPCIARAAGDPRIGPYPYPIGLESAARIKQRFYSADNLSARATDMACASLILSRTNPSLQYRPFDPPRITIAFASYPVSNVEWGSVIVADSSGVVTEYAMIVEPNLQSITPSTVQSRSRAIETQIICNLSSAAQWTLQRNKMSADVRAPIDDNNPLWSWFFKQNEPVQKVDEDNSNERWMQEIEAFTYAEPHRRLWSDPQFNVIVQRDSSESSDEDSHEENASSSIACPAALNRASLPITIEAARSFGSSDFEKPVQTIGTKMPLNKKVSDRKAQSSIREVLEEAMHDVPVPPTTKEDHSKEKYLNVVLVDDKFELISPDLEKAETVDKCL